jgi:hypothetical protein
MAFTISAAMVKTFEDNVRHLAQQKESRLRAWVQEKDKTSSVHSFKRIGQQTLAAKVGRRVATPTNDSAWSNRVATPSPFDGGDTVESEDAAQMIINPTSEITTAFGYAVRRQYDDIIINAAFVNALDETGAVNAFPAAQIVGDYNGEMDFTVASAVNALFLKNNIDPEEPKCFVIGPNQARKILHETRATHGDFVGMATQLVNGGFVKQWMGFSWIVSNRLLLPAAGQVDCIAMTRRALGLLVTEDLFVRVAEDPSQSFLTRVYTKLTAGAVRVEDEHIVRVKMKDSATVAEPTW